MNEFFIRIEINQRRIFAVWSEEETGSKYERNRSLELSHTQENGDRIGRDLKSEGLPGKERSSVTFKVRQLEEMDDVKESSASRR